MNRRKNKPQPPVFPSFLSPEAQERQTKGARSGWDSLWFQRAPAPPVKSPGGKRMPPGLCIGLFAARRGMGSHALELRLQLGHQLGELGGPLLLRGHHMLGGLVDEAGVVQLGVQLLQLGGVFL